MKQDFKILGRHFVTYGASVYLSKLIGFFMIPLYTSYLTPADYGVLELLDLAMYVVGMVVGLGIGNSIIRFYSDCSTESEKRSVISTALYSIVTVAIIINGAIIIFSGPVSRLIFHGAADSYASGALSASGEQLSNFIKIVVVSGFMDIIASVGGAFLQAEKKSALFSFFSIGRFIIAVSLNIYFIVVLQLGVAGILYSQIIASSLTMIGMLIATRSKLGFVYSISKAKEMMRYGMPLIVSTLSMFIIHFTDRFFLERFEGLDELGVYSLSYRFAMVLPALFYGPFELIWNAQMFDLYKRGEDGRKTINHYYKYMFVGSMMIITVYSLVVRDLIFIMADEKFHKAYQVVPVLLCAFMFIGLASISSAGIFFVKKTFYRGIANVYGAVVALIGYYFLINAYGYWGAVVTTLAAFFVRYVVLSIYSQRFYKLEYHPMLYIKVIIVAGITYGAVSSISIDNLYLSLAARGFTGFILFAGLSFILKVFEKYELDAFLNIINGLKNKIPGRA